MAETRPIIEKNGKGYILRIGNLGTLVSLLVGIATLVAMVFMPYKAYVDLANECKSERDKLYYQVNGADSLAKLSAKYSIENNYNMKLYFELGQPKNFKWISYYEIKKKTSLLELN